MMSSATPFKVFLGGGKGKSFVDTVVQKAVDVHGNVSYRFVDYPQYGELTFLTSDESETVNVNILKGKSKGNHTCTALILKTADGKPLRVLVDRGDKSFESFFELDRTHDENEQSSQNTPERKRSRATPVSFP